MKKCPKCLQEKDESCFHKKNSENRLCSWCKDCVYTKQKLRWKHRKKKAVEVLGGKCVKCGYCKNFSALHFRHLDPSEKEFDWNRSRLHKWEKVLKELKKCVILCGNCHAEEHNPECFMDGNTEHANANLNQDKVMSKTGICSVCNKEVFGTKYCSVACAKMGSRKVDRPTKEQLQLDIDSLPMVQIGSKYGVSDNAVRKWAKQYNLIK